MSQVVNGWRIQQQEFECSAYCGMWYVVYQGDGFDSEKYLHSNGAIYGSTQAPDGKWSGYFDTYEQAEAAAARAPRQEVSP